MCKKNMTWLLHCLTFVCGCLPQTTYSLELLKQKSPRLRRGSCGPYHVLPHSLASLAGSSSILPRFGQVDNVHAPKMINIGNCCPPIMRPGDAFAGLPCPEGLAGECEELNEILLGAGVSKKMFETVRSSNGRKNILK